MDLLQDGDGDEPELSDWERYPSEEYEILVAEEGGNEEMWVSAENITSLVMVMSLHDDTFFCRSYSNVNHFNQFAPRFTAIMKTTSNQMMNRCLLERALLRYSSCRSHRIVNDYQTCQKRSITTKRTLDIETMPIVLTIYIYIWFTTLSDHTECYIKTVEVRWDSVYALSSFRYSN